MSDVSGYDSPAVDAFVITPSANRLPRDIRSIYVGTGGNVNVITFRGTTVLFTGVPSGSILPVRCTHVLSASTTASAMVGLV